MADVRSTDNARLALKLAGLCAAAFAFGFALIPLYSAFCEITGLGGKTATVPADVAVLPALLAASAAPTASEGPATPARDGPPRTVRLEFVTTSAREAPWKFRAASSSMQVELGRRYETQFYARNLTHDHLTAQAVPSVAPGLAAQHFKKIECFCFSTQPFAPDEERELKLVFVVAPELPEHMDTVSLSYTLFAVE